MPRFSSVIKTVVGLCCVAGLLAPQSVYSQSDEDKKKAELLKKIQALQAKKTEIINKTNEEVKKNTSSDDAGQSNGEIVARYEKILSTCKGGVKSDKCADVMYTLGKLYYEECRDGYVKAREDYEAAMTKWEKTHQGKEPLNPRPNYDKSLNMYRQAIAAYPDYVLADEGYFQIGSIYLVNGDIDNAKKAFADLIQHKPNSVRASAAHFRLADFCFLDRDFKCAMDHLQKINESEVTPEILEGATYTKGEVYYNQGDLDKAVEQFFTYVDKCDANEFPKKDLRDEAIEYISICYSDMPSGADVALSKFKKIGGRPYEPSVVFNIGIKNFNHGQYAECIPALESAIKAFPNYKDAPIARQMIIACYVIQKKYVDANDAREKMVDTYKPGSEWYNQNSSDKIAIAKGEDEVRKALSAIPIYYHSEFQKSKNSNMRDKAIARYNQFMEMFPEDKWKSYEYKYYLAEIYNAAKEYKKAADTYMFVATQDLSQYPAFQSELDTLGADADQLERMKKEKQKASPVAISQEDAGYNAIVNMDNLRKQRVAKEGVSEAQSYDLAETKAMIDFIHLFAKKFPKSTTTSEVLFIAGNIAFSAKAWPAALAEYNSILTAVPPTDSIYGKGMRMVANTYTEMNEYGKALEVYDKLMAGMKQDSKEYAELASLASAAIFKQADALRTSGNLSGAVDKFKSIFAKFPTSEVAERGWYEAGVTYEKLNNIDGAADVFKTLADKFPASKLKEDAFVRAATDLKNAKKFQAAADVYLAAAKKVQKSDYAIPSLSAAGECFKSANMYDSAGAMNELIAALYPADKNSPTALYNAGYMYEQGKLYAQAIRVYTALSSKYPESPDAGEGAYSVGLCDSALGDNVAMAKAFADYAAKYTGDKSRQIDALARAADAYADMKNFADAEKTASSAISIYETFKGKADFDVGVVAKSYFMLGDIKQRELEEVKLVGKTEKELKAKIDQKTAMLEPVLKAYAQAIGLGVGEYTLRATYKIGECFVEFAADVRDQTLFGSEEQKIAGKIKVISSLEKYYDKAMEKFGWVVQTAYDQKIKNEWVDKSKDEFMHVAYMKGHLFEEVGAIFKDAPVPKGMSTADAQSYRDVLEEKNLEAMDAALPKYEGAIAAAANLGIAHGIWLDSVRARISFINPNSQALATQIQEKVVSDAEASKAAAAASPINPAAQGAAVGGVATDDCAKLMKRIGNIIGMSSSVDDKIAQLHGIGTDAQRQISKEQDSIASLKSKLGIQ